MRRLFRGAGLVILACLYAGLLAAMPGAFAQTAGPQSQAFDVVAIRQIEATRFFREGNSSTTITTAHKSCDYSGEHVSCQLSLRELIEEAFQLKRYEIAGPDWLTEDLFVFQATMPLKTSKDNARLMLQGALRDRFGLSFHMEQRAIASYAMIPAKGGTKLQPAEDAEHRKLLSIGGRGGAVLTMSPGQFSAVAISLESLGKNLQSIAGLDRPVVNMTGLSGDYKVDLHWSQGEDAEAGMGPMDSGLRNAVKVQLGLELEKRQIPMRVLVVDHVNRTPSEN
ncbi:TIGR03435 family protein [Acidicapsa ligni]|uniref:TIGR03435 family protein n=1 Tax=Acidicapsa ligni TaxID=542300 RepID=UPI0021E0BCC7|nr:TIGR03435 family protein [Acidicapsa ligni]